MGKKEQLKQKMLRQQEILNTAKEAGRSLKSEEITEFDSLQREIERLRSEIEIQERGMEGNQEHQNAPPASQNSEDLERAIQNERQRSMEITSLCREFGLEDKLEGYIKGGTSTEQVRAAVIEQMRAGSAPLGQSSLQVTDEQDKFRRAASDSLLLRTGIGVEKPAEGANELRSMSLRDLSIECLSREGKSAGELLRMSKDDLYTELSRQFYNPTSAFPAILDTTIKKSIVQLYNQVPTTFQAWTQKGTLQDFKETSDHEYVIGGTGDFVKVGENGELKADKPKTSALPSRKLDTYGRQFSMTRQAFINDDIGFLTEIPGLYATRAKKTIDKQVYTLLFKNAAIFDGKKLFSADHKNLMTAGARPSQATLQAMILQMQKQTDQFDEAIYVTPKTIVVPIGYEFDLSVLLHSTQVTGSANNDVNPLYNYPLQVVQTPVLNALAGDKACPWFTIADQLSAKSIQVDYLNGQETPTVRRMEAPGVLGFTWDIYLDWGIAVRDFRGMAMNPGEIIK